MPTDNKKIRKAIDDYEDENFVDAEETISKELKKAKNDFFKKKLNLEKDIEDIKDDPDKDEQKDDPDKDE